MTSGTPTRSWKLAGGREIRLDRPRLLTVINVTPDSFFAGSRASSIDRAVSMCVRAIADGADMLDIGGESTRPGASRVTAPDQIERVVPVIEAIRSHSDDRVSTVPISIDTTLSPVAEAALDAGANAVNDVSAGREDDRLIPVCVAHGAGLVLMHRLRPPGGDRYSDRYEETAPPHYEDVTRDVRAFLAARRETAIEAGADPTSLVLDPGLGFGKTVAQNAELVRRTDELLDLGAPILSALSRKSFVGRTSIPDRDSTPEERLPGSIAWSVAHLMSGATLFRVHDTLEQARALRAAWAVINGPDMPGA
jgi:dihydropteroate synthase